MNNLQTSLVALVAFGVLALSMRLVADQTSVSDSEAKAGLAQIEGLSTQGEVPLQSGVVQASQRKPVNQQQASQVENTDEVAAAEAGDGPSVKDRSVKDKEKVWTDISDAITSLNDMVGDDMFRELVRKSTTTMEVRVDLDYWQRVRYETRVDLKNDISNIWHLYVRQYNEDNESAVFFIDDRSGKTIDIFTQRQKQDQ